MRWTHLLMSWRGCLMAESKAFRQTRIKETLSRHAVTSQAALGELLAASGISVTQGTLSRDLVELGVVRVRNQSGSLVYALPEDPEVGPSATNRLARVCNELLLDAQASANMVILKTPPGAAQYLASAIDRVHPSTVLGTIAGDDTVLVIATDPNGGEAVAEEFRELASRSGSRPG